MSYRSPSFQQAEREKARQLWETHSLNVRWSLEELYSILYSSEIYSNESTPPLDFGARLAAVQGWWENNKVGLRISIDTPVDVRGSTALHEASGGGDTEIIRYLVEVCGADVNPVEAQTGQTPLHIAVGSEHPECVRLLLELGADPLVLDDDMNCAINIAQEVQNNQCIDILEQWSAAPTVKSALKG